MQERPRESSTMGYILKVWIAAGIAALTLGLLVTLWHGLGVLLLILAGFLLGLFLVVPARWISSHTLLPQRGAMLLFLLILTGLFVLFGITFATSLSDQFQQLGQVLPESLAQFKDRIRTWPMGDQILRRLEQDQAGGTVLDGLMSRMKAVLTMTFGLVVNLFFIGVIALFVAFEPGIYRRGALLLVFPAWRESVADLMDTLMHKLNWWLLGRLVSMTVVGIAMGVGLWLIGMPMYLSLGVLAAILVFIPNLGPLLAALPALLIALSEGLFGPVAILYLAVQGVESNLITPVIDRQSVKIPPALLLSVQISFGVMAGIVGLLMAAPLAVMGMVVIKRVYVDGWLNRNRGALPHTER